MSLFHEQLFGSEYHTPVLVNAVLGAFDGCNVILDCTLGGGGHTEAMLKSGKTVIGIDRDPSALAVSGERLSEFARSGQFTSFQGDFTQLDQIAPLLGLTFDGILADLGVSSRQLDDDDRGFSFRRGVPLDMRMGAGGVTAADWLNGTTAEELADVFYLYGDEHRARRLAATIVHRRAQRPFQTSDDLVDAIRGALGARTGPGDFARLFQAVRIVVNDEMEGLDRALPVLRDRLRPNGILAMIAYHSGEDRRIKHAMRDWSTACHCPPQLPRCECENEALGELVVRKAIVAEADEAARNLRARSARLRIWRKRG